MSLRGGSGSSRRESKEQNYLRDFIEDTIVPEVYFSRAL